MNPADRKRYETLRQQGAEALNHARYEEAHEAFQQAFELVRDQSDQELVDRARTNLSWVLADLGQYEKAQEGLKEVILRNQNHDVVCVAAYTLASALRRQQKYEKALFFAQKALEKALHLKRRDRTIASFNTIANIFMNDNRLEEAITYYGKSLEASENVSEADGTIPYYRCIALDNLGYCHTLQKEYDTGIDFLKESLSLAMDHQFHRCLAETPQDLCCAYLQTKDLRAAREFGTMALTQAEAYGFIDITRNCYYLLGEVCYLLGEEQESDFYFRKLQDHYPGLKGLGNFLRAFDISDIITLKA